MTNVVVTIDCNHSKHSKNMDKSKAENKGMVFTIIGLLFSTLGMTVFSGKEDVNLSLICSILGVLIILYGLFIMVKANKVETKK